MATTLLTNGTSTFRIKRPLTTTNGFISDVDSTVKDHLTELNTLLSKRVFEVVAAGDIVRTRTETYRLAQAEAKAKSAATEQAYEYAAAKDAVTEDARAKVEAATEKVRHAKSGGDQKASDAAREELKLAETELKNAEKEARRALRSAEEASAAADAAAAAADKAEADLNALKAMGGALPDVTSLIEILDSELTPKRARKDHEPWADDSLAQRIHDADAGNNKRTLAELIDQKSKVSVLRHDFQSYFESNRFSFDPNIQAVLNGNSAIVDYLVSLGYHSGYREINGLKNFILTNSKGAQNIIKYAAVSAARTIIANERLRVHEYDDDDSDFVAEIVAKKLPLSGASFKSKLKDVLNNFVFNGQYLEILKSANIGDIPSDWIPQLIKYMKSYEKKKIIIDKNNINFYLPTFIAEIQGGMEIEDASDDDIVVSDQDFSVDFFQDDSSLIQVSASAVKCAAQLYYAMVLGEELAVFDTVNFFTHRFLLRGGIEIQDSQLRDDLQQYVFSNQFTDLRNGKVVDRTRPAERQMFYKQVFDYGRAQVGQDLIVNSEFPRMWKVLILESAKYIERAQAAFNPTSYVSKQNVMQAVEDLQYNLSTSCTGMVNVISPLIYAELNFIVQRIFMHPEVRRQVVPAGGTWWKVVETLFMAMNHARPKSTVLYNKAKLGHDILRSIAEYNPATFEDDNYFSAFISSVDAFITTQSILQEALTDDLVDNRESDEDYESEDPPVMRTNGASNGMPSGVPSGGQQDEWDF